MSSALLVALQTLTDGRRSYVGSQYEGRQQNDGCLTFVKNKNLAPTNQCPAQSENLALAERKISPTAGQHGVKSYLATLATGFPLQSEQPRRMQSGVQSRIIVFPQWIEVHAQRSVQKLRLIRKVSKVFVK
jgi:hypothetical protein